MTIVKPHTRKTKHGKTSQVRSHSRKTRRERHILSGFSNATKNRWTRNIPSIRVAGNKIDGWAKRRDDGTIDIIQINQHLGRFHVSHQHGLPPKWNFVTDVGKGDFIDYEDAVVGAHMKMEALR